MKEGISDIPQKRKNKEIQLLKGLPKEYGVAIKEIFLGTLIQITFDSNLVTSKYLPKNIKNFTFNLILHNRYPFEPPQLFAMTNFSFPSLADYRDISQDIIGEEWKPMITLAQIINKIPEFVSKVLDNQKNENEDLILFGKYVIGSNYEISQFYVMPQCCIFPCQIPAKSFFQKNQEAIVVITECSILIFTPHPTTKEVGKLELWISFSDLENLSIKEIKKMIFGYKNLNSSEIVTYEIICDMSQKVSELITENAYKLGFITKKANESEKNKAIREMEQKSFDMELKLKEENTNEIKQELIKIYKDLEVEYLQRKDSKLQSILLKIKAINE